VTSTDPAGTTTARDVPTRPRVGPRTSRPVPDDIRQGLDDGTLCTTTDAVARLGHATNPGRIRDWARLGRDGVHAVRDPDGNRVRADGPNGWENVWVYAQLQAAEERTRTSRRGRPRGKPQP